MESEDGFFQLAQYLSQHEQLKHVRKKGLCRVWSGNARDVVKQFSSENELTWKVEVREVDIEPCLSHTFLRLIADGKAYLLDGTGVGIYPEYYGLESEAPKHLRNSHRDWIDRI